MTLLSAHNVLLYFKGKGIIKFDRWTTANVPTGLRDLGNGTAFGITPKVDTLKHYSSRVGSYRLQDREDINSVEASAKFVIEEYDRKNLQMALMADSSPFAIRIMSQASIVGTLDFVSANDPKYHVQLWYCRLLPADEVQFLGDDWGKLTFNVSIQDDSANHPTSPFGLVTPIGWS